MNRYAVRIGSLLALVLTFAVLAHGSARADERLTVQFEGKPFVFGHMRAQGRALAISIDDPGLRSFLEQTGATVTWQTGERYVLVTSGQPVVISFAVGDTRYDVGPVTQNAPFAPFLLDGHPYVPLQELLGALQFAMLGNGSSRVLQPQLTDLEIVGGAQGTKLIARAGMPLDARIVSESPGKIVVLFDGVGSTLPPVHRLNDGPIDEIDVQTLGTPAHPQTQMTLGLAAGSTHTPPGTDDQRDFILGFDGPPPAAAGALPVPSPSGPPAEATAAPVQVTAVRTQPQGGSFVVRIDLDGSATYDWHRLRPPDNRFWIDVHNARLAPGPLDQPGNAPVSAVRAHQEDAQTVRIALSLTDFDELDVVPDATGITITVTNRQADDSVARMGSGSVGTQAVAQASPSAPAGWKFSPTSSATPYVPANPRLIVIDPGHGGSDDGAVRGDLMEKNITLDVSERLRTILVARGWQVVMTRDDDRDVYAADDTATQELQARDDIANGSGARLLVSVHANSYINDGPHGSTVYYYKPSDLPLAQAVDGRIASELDIKNDGVVKDKLYVVHHADMPATLVETAFISNPDDRALLQSPQWRQKMALAIADGIADYAGPPPPAQSASNQ